MADTVDDRRKRSKPKPKGHKFPGIPLSDEALNALREKADREESGIKDPGEKFLEYHRKRRRAKSMKRNERKA